MKKMILALGIALVLAGCASKGTMDQSAAAPAAASAHHDFKGEGK